MENKFNNKKIAVAGIGGVGGYIGALLAKTYPHVTFVARGKRKESLETKGLTLHSEYKGEINVFAENVTEAASLPPQDYIFICVKNYSLEKALSEIAPAVTAETVIIPVMNGIDKGEKTKALLPRAMVIDSLIYIISYSNPDFSITHQGKFTDVKIGVKNPTEKEKEKTAEVCALLNNAGVDCIAAEDIELEIWRKYILNCAYNVATAYYNNTIGELRDAPKKAAEYEALVDEACTVAKAKGVKILPSHRDEIIYRFYNEHPYNATSSLQRDINANRPAELETFGEYLTREAERLGLSVPVSLKMYEGLRQKI